MLVEFQYDQLGKLTIRSIQVVHIIAVRRNHIITIILTINRDYHLQLQKNLQSIQLLKLLVYYISYAQNLWIIQYLVNLWKIKRSGQIYLNFMEFKLSQSGPQSKEFSNGLFCNLYYILECMQNSISRILSFQTHTHTHTSIAFRSVGLFVT